MPEIASKVRFPVGDGGNQFDRKFPTASDLMTIAGRVFFISEPRVGSMLTSQTSPRLGVSLVVNNVTCHQVLSLGVLLVVILYRSGLCG